MLDSRKDNGEVDDTIVLIKNIISNNGKRTYIHNNNNNKKDYFSIFNPRDEYTVHPTVRH